LRDDLRLGLDALAAQLRPRPAGLDVALVGRELVLDVVAELAAELVGAVERRGQFFRHLLSIHRSLLLRGLRDDRRHAAGVARIRITGVAEIQLRRALGNRERLDVAGPGAGEPVADRERLVERGVLQRAGDQLVAAVARRRGPIADEHAQETRTAGV